MPEPLAIPAGDAVLGVMRRLADTLDGSAAPFVPYAAGSPPPDLPAAARVRGAARGDRRGAAPPDGRLPDGLAVCVGTSGSTGVPKLAMLTSAALTHSARATLDVLGGDGQWLLPMPAHHIAGLQVLVRSLLSGTTPVVLDLAPGFSSPAFAEATSRLTGRRRYTAIVPTQLARLLGDAGGRVALTAYDGVLVGGAGTPRALLSRAREAGVRAVTTYGMSETAGGCVYDGVPLPGARVRLDDDGRIDLGGPTLAEGYLGRRDLTASVFSTDASGTRWFRTDDVGHVDDAGRYHVDGRVDDLITTGALKVAPRLVEDALLAHVPGVREAVVVGSPDPEWGEVVSAALVVDSAQPLGVPDVRAALRDHLPPHALPRRVALLAALPLRGPGKPDRGAVRAVFGDENSPT